MTKVKPFKALSYNQDKIQDLSKVVCPPYDIISPSRQQYLHDLDPHNFIRIILGKDTPGEDKYKRAAGYLNQWLENKIMVCDTEPAIYVYAQDYKIKGENRSRLGFIALLRLPDKHASVFGHERTSLPPKEDRLKLLRSTQANLSPIFVVFGDKRRIVSLMLKEYISDKTPFIDIVDDEKNTHKVWRVTDPGILKKIQASMEGENIFIADGHHRFEVACAFKDEMLQKTSNYSGEEDFNYTLAYFTNTDMHGLCILPVHRLVTLGRTIDTENLILMLKEHFDLEEIKHKDKIRFFFLLEKAGMHEHVIGMYKDSRQWLVRLKNIKILDRVMGDRPPEFRQLDAAIFNQMILNRLISSGTEEAEIVYTHNANDVLEAVDRNPASIGFLLNPARIEQITSVALSGEKMPPKSTYFYPKVLSGLVINKHQQI
jgi:uncharacterized protein (DUF1015 family)